MLVVKGSLDWCEETHAEWRDGKLFCRKTGEQIQVVVIPRTVVSGRAKEVVHKVAHLFCPACEGGWQPPRDLAPIGAEDVVECAHLTAL